MEDPTTEYKILPNLVPPSYADVLEQELNDIHWYWYPSASGDVAVDPDDKNIYDSQQLQHVFIDETGSVSSYTALIQPIVWFLEKEMHIKIKSVARVKANLLMPGNTTLENYNIPHIDTPDDDYISMVYYVNDADGDTKIFHKTIDQGHKDLYTIASVEPKKGKAVVFKSNRFHASTPPLHTEKRMIINFVLQIGN